MRPRGEELGDAGGVEAVLREPDGRPETCASCAHHHRVIRVVHHRVRRLQMLTATEEQSIVVHSSNTKPSHRIEKTKITPRNRKNFHLKTCSSAINYKNTRNFGKNYVDQMKRRQRGDREYRGRREEPGGGGLGLGEAARDAAAPHLE